MVVAAIGQEESCEVDGIAAGAKDSCFVRVFEEWALQEALEAHSNRRCQRFASWMRCPNHHRHGSRLV